MTDRMVLLGVDVGGTHLRVATAHGSGQLLTESSEVVGDLTPAAFLARVSAVVRERAPGGVAGVAVGLPAPIDESGTVGRVVNAPRLENAPMRQLLADELAAPVIVENDVNLAVLGEQRCGHHGRSRHIAFVAIGTGIGMGILADGQIVRGARGGAGELGMLPIGLDVIAPGRDSLGPLEVLASGAGIAARWSAVTGQPATGRDVFAAAEAGSRAAIHVLADQSRALAMAIRAVQALFDPDVIVMGGGIGSREDVLARVRGELTEKLPSPPRLERSSLGVRAGVVGAIEAARDLARGLVVAETAR